MHIISTKIKPIARLALNGKQSTFNARDPGLIPQVLQIPLEKGMLTQSSTSG